MYFYNSRRNLIFVCSFIVLIILVNPLKVMSSNDVSYEDLKSNEFMKKWLILGPVSLFDTEKPDYESQKKAFNTDFLTDQGGESSIKVTLGLINTIKSNEYKWQYYESKDDIINLTEVFGVKDYVTAYAWVEVDSVEAKDVLLGVGSDDGIKVWLNGKLIHEKWIARGVNKDEDLIKASLQKGENYLLFKVQNMVSTWGFCCRVLGKESLTERLVSAAGAGNLDDIDMLVSYGADVNAKNDIGITALHKATMAGRKEVVNILIERGADPNIKMPDKEALADAVFNKVFKGASSGASVLVAKDGKIIYQKGFGYADIGNKVPFTVDTKSRIGSHSKQFTASAILKLQEEGKLSVNDKLSKFIPDFPRGDEVKLHHLLTHTSGIRSYTSKPEIMDNAATEIKPEKLLDSFKNDPFDFNPGDKFRYNNSGYFLLGYIVEKVSGQSLDDYLKKTFFEPLGMKNTGVHNSMEILENEAYGYIYDNGKFRKATNYNMSRFLGCGSLYSTVEDLYLWNEGVFNGKVLNEESFKSAFTPVKLNDGKEPKEISGEYGYGWAMMENRGLRVILHEGKSLDKFPLTWKNVYSRL